MAGRPDLEGDERFLDPDGRARSAPECIVELRSMFASVTLAEIRGCFAPLGVAWEPYQRSEEILEDPQVIANDYVAEVKYPSGDPAFLVRAPVRVDGKVEALVPAPTYGQHSAEILAEVGFGPHEIAEMLRPTTATSL